MKSNLRSWWEKIKQHRLAIGIVAVVLAVVIVLIIAGYWFDWTGFNGYNKVSIATETTVAPQRVIKIVETQSGKTLWDWLQLLVVPAVLSLFALWFTLIQQLRDRDVSEKRAQIEHEIAKDDQREAALQDYINKMSELLEKQLRKLQPEEEKRIIARARTLNVLRQLDSGRKGNVIQFLYESHLLSTRIIDLSYTQLSEANLYRARLSNANLFRSGLFKANLFQAKLSLANLSEAYLVEADLRGAKLCYADLRGANLRRADLRGADLREAKLDGAKLQEALYNKKKVKMKDPLGEELLSLESTYFPDGFNCEGMTYVDCYSDNKPEECQVQEDQSSTSDTERLIDLSFTDLSFTDLSYKILSRADLYRAELIEANLFHADLNFANLSGAVLHKANLSGAVLHKADLSGAILHEANLIDAKISQEQLGRAASLKDAIMPDGSKHS